MTGNIPHCWFLKEKNKREQYIDLLRGIGIVAVVIGHAFNTDNYFSYDANVIRKFCYFFRLSVFFFCSGYLYKVYRPLQFVIRMFKKYYFPFILVGLSSLAFYPLWNSLGVVTPLENVDVLHKVKNIFLFKNDGLLTGAMWFVIFFAMAQLQYTFISYCTSVAMNKFNVSLSSHNLTGIISWALGFCGLYIVSVRGGGRYCIWLSLLMLPIMWLGQFCHEHKTVYLNFINNSWLALVSGALLIAFSLLSDYEIELSKAELCGGYLFYPITILGLVFCLSIVGACDKSKYVRACISHCGRMSFWIMAYQFMSFKFFDGIAGLIFHFDLNVLQLYPYSFAQCRLFYILLGITLPSVIGLFLKKLQVSFAGEIQHLS